MSRGPGRWQRAVLDATADAFEWLTVEDIAVSVDPSPEAAGSTLSHAEREAIRRAIRVLTERGEVASTHVAGELLVGSVEIGSMQATVNEMLERVAHGHMTLNDAVAVMLPEVVRGR